MTLRECVASKRYEADVQCDLDDAGKMGRTGTPTFIIGKSDEAISGPIIRGAVPTARFSVVIDSILADVGAGS